MADNSNNTSKTHWSIEELYRKAWPIVWKNKILWIFAAAACSGGLSFRNGFNFGGNDSKLFRDIFQTKPAETAGSVQKVLGAATSAPHDLFSALFSSVPVWLYFILIAELLLFITILGIISFISQSWATGALLTNIQSCLSGGKATIHEASEKALRTIKPLILLNVIPGIIIAATALVGFSVLGIGLSVSPPAFKVIFGLLIAALMVLLFYSAVMLAFSLIWAQRLVVNSQMPARKALWTGYYLARKKFWPSILLAVVNNILSVIILGAPVVAGAGFILLTAFSGFSKGLFGIHNSYLTIIAGLLAVLLIPAFIVFLTVASSVITAFKAAVWSLAFNKIKLLT